MAVPRAVARQGQRAEEIRKKVYEEGKTPQELGVKTDPPPGEAPTEEPETPVPPETEPGKETPLPIDYKVKYEEAVHQIATLKGKLDSEVPELVSTNRMMAGEIANLQATVSDLQASIKKPAQEPIVEKQDPQEATDLKLYQDNYPEIHRGQIIVMRQWVKSEEFKNMVSSIVDEMVSTKVEPRVASVEKEVKTSKEDTFSAKMDTLVRDENGNPCWRQINDDKEFTAWLKANRYGGFTKLELLRAAVGKGDAEGVAEYFNDWLKSKKPAATPPKKEGDDVKPDKPVVDEDVAPARPGSAQVVKKGGNGEDKEQTFTRSFVKKFHTDVALGRYKNRPKEREKIKAEIDEAMAKGLIING